MKPAIKLLLLLFCSLLTSSLTEGKTNEEQVEKRKISEKDLDKYKLDEKGFDKVRTIHTNWYVHSMKALIAQLSRNLLPKISDEAREELLECLSKIHDKKDLVESSKCVMRARERYDDERKRGISKRVRMMNKWKNEKKVELVKKQKTVEKKTDTLVMEFKKKWRNANKLRKMTKKQKMFAPLMKKLNIQVRRKRSLQRLVADTVSKSDSYGYTIKNVDKMPSLLSTKESRTVVQKVTNLLKQFVSNTNDTDSTTWMDTYKSLIALKSKMDKKEKEPGARVYNERMYDLVLDNQVHSEHRDSSLNMFDKNKMPDIMQRAFDLMGTIDRKGGKRGDSDSNVKFLSPRFASIMPDKNENHGHLSPSILPFYNDESEDQIVPLPKVLEATGLNGKDRDSVIDMVMEMSGAKTIVKNAIKILKDIDMPELEVAVSDNAKKSMKMVDEIKESYNKKQKNDMKTKGFALMEPQQMDKIMNDQGIGGRKDIFNVEEYSLLSMLERKELVWDMVRSIAYGPQSVRIHSNSTGGRYKRQAWGPHILSPTVLTPLLFTPIFGLNVLGPTVLSPGLFTPLILNPAVLSPYVFSPTVAIPFILSPYVLSPYVFSPLVMAPFILNPYVLSPNVFNPYVLSPLILSPLVICPDVVSPMTLGGAILSPGVLSPSVLSKSYIMANILSPTFLSK